MAGSGLRAWVKDNVAVALTVGGLVLYVLLRLPYAVYYGRLGVDPEDVGLGYVETLARSTLAIALIVLVIALGAALGVFVFGVIVVYARLFAVVLHGERPSSRRLEDFDDEAWETERARNHRMLRRMLGARGDEVEELLGLADTQRLLLRKPDRTSEDEAHIRDLAHRATRRLASLGAALAARLARRFAAIAAVGTFLLVLVLVPVRAYRDAEYVRRCESPQLGWVISGRFAIRGSEATVVRLQEDGTTKPVMADRTLRYLGRDDDRIVLFDCVADRVVVLPADGIVVVSTPDE